MRASGSRMRPEMRLPVSEPTEFSTVKVCASAPSPTVTERVRPEESVRFLGEPSAPSVTMLSVGLPSAGRVTSVTVRVASATWVSETTPETEWSSFTL